MDRRSDNLPLVMLGGALGLLYLFHTIWGMLFEDWLKHELEHSLGLSEAEVIEKFAQLGFPALGAIAIVWLLYRFISKDFNRQLAEALKPRLVCRFDKTIPGCIVQTSFSGVLPADYYRIEVSVRDVGFLSACRGHLVSIKKDGQLRSMGETLPLTFKPAEKPDTTSKEIHSGLPEFLDLLAITAANQVIVTTEGLGLPNSINPERLFADHGRYDLEVVVLSPRTAPARMMLNFTWTGARDTAKLDVI